MTTKCIFYEKDLAQCLAQIKNLIQDSLHRKERESGGREGKEGERRRKEGRGERKGAGQREKKRREGGRKKEVYTISPANQFENYRCQRQYDLCSQVRHSSTRFTTKHWLQSRLGSKKSLFRTRSQ